MDFGLVGLPVLTVVTVFLFSVFTAPTPVQVTSFHVPPALLSELDETVTPAAILERLDTAMQDLERLAVSFAEPRHVSLAAGLESSSSLLDTVLPWTPWRMATQSQMGLLPYTVSGGLREEGGLLVLDVQIRDRNGTVNLMSARAPRYDLNTLVQRAARQTLLLFDPYTMAAASFRQDFAGRNFTRTRGVLADALGYTPPRERAWLLNLSGMTAFFEGYPNKAIRRFREALLLEPALPFPRLNWSAVLLAQGFPGEARAVLAPLVERHPAFANPIVLAGAYTLNGTALAAEGRDEDALDFFRRATRIAPSYADAYRQAAGVLGGQGRLNEAIEQARNADRIGLDAPRLTENLLIATALGFNPPTP